MPVKWLSGSSDTLALIAHAGGRRLQPTTPEDIDPRFRNLHLLPAQGQRK